MITVRGIDEQPVPIVDEAENIVEEKLGSSSDDNREPEILVYPVSYRTGGGGL